MPRQGKYLKSVYDDCPLKNSSGQSFLGVPGPDSSVNHITTMTGGTKMLTPSHYEKLVWVPLLHQELTGVGDAIGLISNLVNIDTRRTMGRDSHAKFGTTSDGSPGNLSANSIQ